MYERTTFLSFRKIAATPLSIYQESLLPCSGSCVTKGRRALPASAAGRSGVWIGLLGIKSYLNLPIEVLSGDQGLNVIQHFNILQFQCQTINHKFAIYCKDLVHKILTTLTLE